MAVEALTHPSSETELKKYIEQVISDAQQHLQTEELKAKPPHMVKLAIEEFLLQRIPGAVQSTQDEVFVVFDQERLLIYPEPASSIFSRLVKGVAAVLTVNEVQDKYIPITPEIRVFINEAKAQAYESEKAWKSDEVILKEFVKYLRDHCPELPVIVHDNCVYANFVSDENLLYACMSTSAFK